MKVSKKEIITFSLVFVFSLIIFYQFLEMHYATDTYVLIENGYYKYAINESLLDGRVFMAIIGLIAGVLNIPNVAYIISTLVIGLFISSISVIVLKNIILKYKPAKNKYYEWLVLLISYITIFNFMYLENMYFADCITMSLSVLLYILAAKKLADGSKYSILKSLILFILAVFSYQGTIGIFLAMVVLFFIIKNAGVDYISTRKAEISAD